MAGRRKRMRKMAQALAVEIAEERMPKRKKTRKIGLQDSPYQVTDTDRLVLVDSSRGPVEILLPPNANNGMSEDLIIKDVAGKASVNPITVTPQGTGRLDGAVQRKITTANTAATMNIGEDGWLSRNPAEMVDAQGPAAAMQYASAPGSTMQSRVEFTCWDIGCIKIAVVPEGKTVLSCTVVITEAFDGNGATMSLGTSLLPGAIFSSSQVTPTIQATYRSEEPILMTTTQSISLEIEPGQSTTGAGYVVITTT